MKRKFQPETQDQDSTNVKDEHISQPDKKGQYDMDVLRAWRDAYMSDEWMEGIEYTEEETDYKNLAPWEAAQHGYSQKKHPLRRTQLPQMIENELDIDQIEREVQDAMTSISVTDGFCTVCHTILEDWPVFRDTASRSDELSNIVNRKFHLTTINFEATMRNGCLLCTQLLQCLQKQDQLINFYLIEQRLRHLDSTLCLELSIADNQRQSGNYSYISLNPLGKPGTDHEYNSTRMHVYTCSPAGKSPDDLFLKEQLLSNPKSNIYEVIKLWMRMCSMQHKQCTLDRKNLAPTRLIDVMSTPPRLVVTVDQHWVEAPLYATLSHCWGQEPFFCLTADNLESLISDGMDTSSLTKTFNDAIEITRELGLRYLWIDSLCIIQGDKEDWAKESMRMSSVYSGSHLNIAASSAKSGKDGCSLKHNVLSESFHAKCKSGGTVLFQHFELDSLDYRYGQYEEATVKPHLATRAWCFQERILPSRTIYCGDQGLWWGCREHSAPAYSPFGCDSESHKAKRSLLIEGVESSGKTAERWQNIVEHYTCGNLTNSEDKLVAIAGIAKAAHTGNGHEYLAGMWKPWLMELLCWRIREYLHLKPKLYRAPSWSWAAIDGKVYHPQHSGGKKYAHVLQAHVTPATTDPFGQISSGVLTLCCSQLVPGTLHLVLWGVNECMVAQHILDFWFLRDYIFPPDITELEIVLMPIHRRPSSHEKVEGLVLQASGGAKGEYCRIGYFKPNWNEVKNSESYTPFPALKEDILNHFKGSSPPLEVLKEICSKMPELAIRSDDTTFPGAPFVINII